METGTLVVLGWAGMTRGELFGASIANDDDHDPLVGEWITIERVELLQLPPR